jgi:16S rRNA (cytosine1402-N4)-methyltransferase
LAKEVVHNRPIKSTLELSNLIIGKSRYSKTHPAAKIFQALRIVVNDELSELERTLPLLPKLLNKGGRVGIITFHSLEDRLVKEYFKDASSYGEESELKLVNKKPIVAGVQELGINPRARSAKLRVAIRD